MGRADGFTNDQANMESRGGPSNWQFLALDSVCGGSSQATVEHEVLHALGIAHEHQRPDRADYIIVDESAAQTPSNFFTIDNWVDSGNQFPFELESVMTYCSSCGSADSTVPIMTLLDGTTFGDSLRMTTTDSKQLLWTYCQTKQASYQEKETIPCTSEDRVVAGFHRPVYVDRICDGISDCREAEDELGGLGVCIPFQANTLTSNCCSILLIDSVECHVNSIGYNGKDTYTCVDNDDHVIFNYDGKWIEGNAGLPDGGYSYRMYEKTDNICPPIGLWTSEGKMTENYVFCKSLGVDNDDGCNPDPCSNDHATCIDQFNGYRCDCDEGYEANGNNFEANGAVCTAIPLIDECADPVLNTCHSTAVCINTLRSYTCECTGTSVDVNVSNPGRDCMEVEPCCNKIKIFKDYGSNIIVHAICVKADVLNNEYFSYDCHESGITIDQYFDDVGIIVPATIVYIDHFEEWLFMENILSNVAITSSSFSYKSAQIKSEIRPFCPALGPPDDTGETGFTRDWNTECLEYDTGKYADSIFLISI